MSKNIPRIFTPQPLAAGVSIALAEAQAHYLRNVMRLNMADALLIFNGSDGEWRVEITDISKKSMTVQAREQTRPQAPETDLWLCFAPVKNVRTDFIAQKATELGVSALQPVITRRTIVTRVNEERLRANAIEAAEQCERLTVPDVLPTLRLEAMLTAWPKDRRLLLCDETGGGKPILEALCHPEHSEGSHTAGDSSLTLRMTSLPWAILIGPEGGFAEEELALLRPLPYVVPVGLGPRILRADTAAVAALSCWQASLGDWNNG